MNSKRTGQPPPSATEPTCPFCGDGVAERSRPGLAYQVWESECGAIGSGSPMYPDLDEVADGLLATLGFSGSVSKPSSPIGKSGQVFMQHYDIPKSLDQLQEILRGHDFEMQTSTWSVSGHQIHSIWVRRRIV